MVQKNVLSLYRMSGEGESIFNFLHVKEEKDLFWKSL